MSGVHVHVRVAGEDYAVPVGTVLEVAELGDVTPVPGAPAQVLGVRNLRGQVIPVLDLAAILGLGAEGTPERIVVAQQRGNSAGIAVDEVVDVTSLPDATEETESEYLTGATLLDGALIGLLDVPATLDAAERQ